MKRFALVAAVATFLIGCGKENSVQDETLSSELRKEPTTISAGATTGAPSVPRPKAARVTEGPPPASPIPTPVSVKPEGVQADPAPPAGSGEAIALATLDEQARRELDGGFLSPSTQLHSEYSSQSRQEDWASFVEENLKRHFLNRKFSALDVVRIDCKTSICEILAVARNAAIVPDALESWQKELFSLRHEEWWQHAQMGSPTFQVSSTKDRNAVFVTHVMRAAR